MSGNNRNNANLVNIYNKQNLDVEMGALRDPVTGTGSGVAVTPPIGYYFSAIFNQSTAALVISAATGLNGTAYGAANIVQNATWLIPCTTFTPASGSYTAYIAPLLYN
jgi:hypothetical protein